MYIPSIIDVPSIIIVFSNVLTFMFMGVAFFWFIGSNNISNLINNKSDLFISLIKQNQILDLSLRQFINSTAYLALEEKAHSDYEKRYNYNIELTKNWMVIPFSIMIGLLVITVSIEICFNKKFDKIDALILCTVFACFLTEIIFYFTVISRSEIISDFDIIELVINKIGIKISV